MYWKLERRGPLLCSGRNFGRLDPTVAGEAELVNDKLQYLAEISKQSVEGMTCFLLAVYSKMCEG